jgi:hypothetical protein
MFESTVPMDDLLQSFTASTISRMAKSSFSDTVSPETDYVTCIAAAARQRNAKVFFSCC